MPPARGHAGWGAPGGGGTRGESALLPPSRAGAKVAAESAWEAKEEDYKAEIARLKEEVTAKGGEADKARSEAEDAKREANDLRQFTVTKVGDLRGQLKHATTGIIQSASMQHPNTIPQFVVDDSDPAPRRFGLRQYQAQARERRWKQPGVDHGVDRAEAEARIVECFEGFEQVCAV